MVFCAFLVLAFLALQPAMAEEVLFSGKSPFGAGPGTGHSPASSIMFIENIGQWPAAARFQVWGASQGPVWLAEDALWLAQPDHNLAAVEQSGLPPESSDLSASMVPVKLSFVNSNSHPMPLVRLDTRVSYFLGSDPSLWRSDVPVWREVRYPNLYPGVDFDIAGENDRLVWRFVTQDSASLKAVRLRVEGTVKVEARASGEIALVTTTGTMVLPRFTTLDGSTLGVEILNDGMLAFAPMTPNRDAIELESGEEGTDANAEDSYRGTFLGGYDFDEGNAIRVAKNGDIVVVGTTFSSDFPTTAGVIDTTLGGRHDLFVARFDSQLGRLVFATFVGGGDRDAASTLSLDKNDAIYAAGWTESYDFPTTPGAFDASYFAGGDAFVLKLNATGNELLYSTYLGGSRIERAEGLAVGVDGSAYITGHTRSWDFPTTPGAFDREYSGPTISQYGDAYVAKLAPSGNELVYSTFVGGTDEDDASGIAVGDTGAAYLVGWTSSRDFPVTNSTFGATFTGAHEVFITKMSPSGANLSYSGFLGGSGDDQGQAIAVDALGAAYISGQTNSQDFRITTGAYDSRLDGIWDGFAAKIAASGSHVTYSTFIGGSSNDCETPGIDRECVLTVNASGEAYIAGRTYSDDFPITSDGYDKDINGNEDGFLVKLSSDGKQLMYGSYFGGVYLDHTLAVDVSAPNFAIITGRTYSVNFPTSAGAFDQDKNGDEADVFVVKLAVGPTPTPTPTPSRTATFTPTATPTPTPTPTRRVSPTPTWTPTKAISSRLLFLPSQMRMPSRTPSPTSTPSFTPTPTATTQSPPAAPVMHLVANPLCRETYAVVWEPVIHADDYLLEEARDRAFTLNVTQPYSGASAFFVVTSRGASRYYYRVRARNAFGASSWSNVQWTDVCREQEPNDGFSQANGPLWPGVVYTGQPNTINDSYDVYRFLPSTSGNITIEMTNHLPGTQLQLYKDSSANLVAYDTSPPYRIDYLGSPDDYYLVVYNNASQAPDPQYNLTLQFPSGQP